QRTEELERLTYTDPVTGLLNRRGMMEELQQHMRRLQQDQETFGVLWLDLDRFKNINDQYGHATGDLALKTTAQIIQDH
ncbi:GGDEF domain-containing protein, partial [Gilvimarinus sp. 1_MG-2023]